MTQPLGHAQEYMRLVSSQLVEDANILRHYEASQRSAIAKLRRNRFAIVAPL